MLARFRKKITPSQFGKQDSSQILSEPSYNILPEYSVIKPTQSVSQVEFPIAYAPELKEEPKQSYEDYLKEKETQIMPANGIAMPFTILYLRTIESLILEYLHPSDLEVIAQATKRPFDEQVYFQIPAKDNVNNSYKVLLESLLNIARAFFADDPCLNDSIDWLDAKNQYITFRAKLESRLKSQIEKFNPIKYPEWISVLIDCIMHFSYGKPMGWGSDLIDNLITQPEKIQTILFLLSQGALINPDTLLTLLSGTNSQYPSIFSDKPTPLNLTNLEPSIIFLCQKDRAGAGQLLTKLIDEREKTNLSKMLIMHGAELSKMILVDSLALKYPKDFIVAIRKRNFFGEGAYPCEGGLANSVFFAALHSDDLLNYILKEYHNNKLIQPVTKAFFALRKVAEKETIFLLDIENSKGKIELSPEKCYEAAVILLNKYAKFDQLVPRAALELYNIGINKAKTPQEWFFIYSQFVDAPYFIRKEEILEVSTRTYTQKTITYGRVAREYSTEKKEFIEKIQSVMVDYFNSLDNVRDFMKNNKMEEFYEQCKKILHSHLFNDDHFSMGVTKQYHKQLEARVAEMAPNFDKGFAVVLKR